MRTTSARCSRTTCRSSRRRIACSGVFRATPTTARRSCSGANRGLLGGMALLAVRGLSRRYGAVVALRSADLTVEPGEIHALVGANGAGKSTLVKMLTGVIRPDSGTITVRDRPVSIASPAASQRAGLAAVFQDPALVPDLTVLQNLRLTGTGVPIVRRWLRMMELGDVDLGELVADLPLPIVRLLDLARALAREPQLLLLD